MNQSRIVQRMSSCLPELAVDRQASNKVRSLVLPKARKSSKHPKRSVNRLDLQRKRLKHSQALPLQEEEAGHAKTHEAQAVLTVTLST